MGRLIFRNPLTTIRDRLEFAAGRFPGLNQAELGAVVNFGERGVESAGVVSSRPSDAGIDIADIGIQPFLFGDDPAGRRLLFEVDVGVPFAGRSFPVSVEVPAATSLDDILAQARENAFEIIRRYPGDFGLDSVADVTPEMLEALTVTFIERRF